MNNRFADFNNIENCPYMSNRFADFNNIENCPCMREGDGSVLGNTKLNNAKIDIFIFLCDNLAHNRAIKLKI